VSALDQRIVDRIPETPADISAQLQLFHAFLDEASGWGDERDERLYESMLARSADHPVPPKAKASKALMPHLPRPRCGQNNLRGRRFG
jgi:hypothetical protein